ncbi:zinc metallopeptidase [Proteinivorax hydrogeniformans]|uniref:Zinc metallopeptidase n=1 Tax=Proteinivorax hydrogeniformans TaxID=1826727 RepID=A0AAU8HWA0_9FIRM
MFFPIDTTIIYLIPAILLTIIAQGKVKSAYAKYSKILTKNRYTGYQVADQLLKEQGIYDVDVELTSGHLSDHYDPLKKKVRLSREVYNGASIASVSIAAHEVGHAIQHAQGYSQLKLRNAIFPIAMFGSSMAWIFIVAGLFFAETGYTMMNIGIILFSAAVLFKVVTLPVEFNASSRAVKLLGSSGIIASEERPGVKQMLNAAALTYVAAMATAVAQLIRLIALRNRRHR